MEEFLALYAVEEFHHFSPCLDRAVSPEQMRKVFVKFMQDYPAQQYVSGQWFRKKVSADEMIAIMVLKKALYYGLCPGPKLGLKPHMEYCTQFDHLNGEIGTRNARDEPVFVRFLATGKGLIEGQLASGEVLLTGCNGGQSEYKHWMFVTCPAGHVSAPSLAEENRETVVSSRYSCVSR